MTDVPEHLWPLAAIAWGQRSGAPAAGRAFLLTAAVLADAAGYVGPITDKQMGSLLGLDSAATAGARRWLSRHGAIADTAGRGTPAVISCPPAYCASCRLRTSLAPRTAPPHPA